MKREKKSIQTAYIYWVFLGLAAGHRFYIGGWRCAWSLLTLTVGAVIFLTLGFATNLSAEVQDTLGGMGVIMTMFGVLLYVMDLALIPGLVRSANEGDYD